MALINSFFPQAKKVALDLGSNRVRLSVPEINFFLDEPSCLAVEKSSQKVLAVGQRALEMSERPQSHIQIFWPISEGMIVYPTQALTLLKIFLSQALPTAFFFKPKLVVSSAAALQVVEAEYISELLGQLGVQDVIVVPQALAAAIGAGVPIAQAAGASVLHLGASKVEAAVLSVGSITAWENSSQAGNYALARLQALLRQKYGLEVSNMSAQKILSDFVSVLPGERVCVVAGKMVKNNAPGEVEIKSIELQPLALSWAEKYLQLMREVFKKTPVALITDLIDRGILLTGGFSQLVGLRTYLSQELGTAILRFDEPDLLVIRGLETVLAHLEQFKESAGYL